MAGRTNLIRAAVTTVASTGLLTARAQRVVAAKDGHHAHWRRRAQQPGDATYVALGDSLTAGIGCRDPEQGFVGQLARRLADGGELRVVNLGISGATLADLLRDQLPVAREFLADATWVTVCIGANDAGTTARAQFAADFAELCDALPDGALVADVPSFQGGHRATEAATLARTCRSVVAERPGLRPVAVEAATTGMGLLEFSGDLFHPNARGHRRYADAFAAAAR